MVENNLRLWLDGQEADIDASTTIVFNYTLEDITAPGVIKNSWSYTATLPPTAKNHAIFSRAYDPAMSADHGLRRDFVLMDAKGNIIEYGYFKLSKIKTKANGICTGYEINLFGELGAMLYKLSENEETGETLTLADLDWDVGDLSFTIKADIIKTRWGEMQEVTEGNLREGNFTMAQTINFAMCYEGTDVGQDGFDADKYLMKIPDGWEQEVTEDEVTYTTLYGYALLEMPQEINGFDIHDLRSYLQRPVFSVAAFLSAVKNTLAKNGYTFEIGDNVIKLESLRQAYITLPLFTQMDIVQSQLGAVNISEDFSYPTTSYHTETFNINFSESVPDNTTVTVNYSGTLYMEFDMDMADTDTLAFQTSDGSAMGFWLRMDLLDENDSSLNHIEYMIATDENIQNHGGNIIIPVTEGPGAKRFSFSFAGTLSGVEGVKVQVKWTIYNYKKSSFDKYGWNACGILVTTEDEPNVFGSEFIPAEMVSSVSIVQDVDWEVTTENSSFVSSGTYVSQKMLFGALDMTPASLLTDIVKVWGLALKQTGSKAFELINRDELYSTVAPVDITECVDVGQEIEIVPRIYESRYVILESEAPESEYAERYKTRNGIDWGRQVINTGYYFDSSEKNIWDGIGLRFYPSVMPRNNFQYGLNTKSGVTISGGRIVPVAVYLGGCTYNLVSNDGDEEEISPRVSSVEATAFNDKYEGYTYDGWTIPQFADSDGGGVEGAGVLLFYEEQKSLNNYFVLTDDNSYMTERDAGNRCWSDYSRYELYASYFPLFTSVNKNLGFCCGAVPDEFESPGSAIPEKSFYTERWKNYLFDRCLAKQRVVTIKGRLDSLIGRGADGLGKFVWWRGRIWVVNKISNYDVTGKTLSTYELISVDDVKNYTDGQNDW